MPRRELLTAAEREKLLAFPAEESELCGGIIGNEVHLRRCQPKERF
jgi:hypothetical protein